MLDYFPFSMPKGIPLKDFPKSGIDAYKNYNKCVWEVACVLYASPNTVSNFMRKQDINSKRKKTNRF